MTKEIFYCDSMLVDSDRFYIREQLLTKEKNQHSSNQSLK